MKPTAWYDPSNGVVSTNRDCPAFTPLGQVWPLFPKGEWVGLTDDEVNEIYTSVEIEVTELIMESYDRGVKDGLETSLQLIKILRPAINPLGGKTTHEWFDILVKNIEEKI